VQTALNTKIRLDWKTGVAATNWGEIAKKENLDAMAVELRKLEDTVKEIHDEMLFLRKREEEMRNLNGVHA
jgi:p24 family protein delta-1